MGSELFSKTHPPSLYDFVLMFELLDEGHTGMSADMIVEGNGVAKRPNTFLMRVTSLRTDDVIYGESNGKI